MVETGRLRHALAAALSRMGLTLRRNHAYRDPAALMALKANELAIDTILDIGANSGQFATRLRKGGWRGRIVCFEPLADAHARLSAAAGSKWEVAPRMALGDANGETTINIAGNSVSSSILPVYRRSIAAAPGSKFIATERTPLRRLDDIAGQDWGDRLAIKIDTQGYEAAVLAGAEETLHRTLIVTLEMSLAGLYEGAPSLPSLFAYLESRHFRCIAINEGFSDRMRNEMLQVDATFVRART